MRRILLLSCIMLSSLGCAAVPFERTSYVPLESVDPQLARREFESSLPDSFKIVNSIVFKYKWRSFSALGYLDVNRGFKTFSASCLNSVGIKLFELSGDQDVVRTHFVLKELLSKGDLPQVAGDDIRRIYFGNVPSGEAGVQKEKHRVVFSEPSDSGVIKYVFAGSPTLLVEKKYYEKNRLIWSVFYYEYRQERGKYYPAGIMLKNSRFDYRLIVRLKEVR